MLTSLLSVDGARTLFERELPHLRSGGRASLDGLHLRDVRAGRHWRIVYPAVLKDQESGRLDRRPIVVQSVPAGEDGTIHDKLTRMAESSPLRDWLSGLMAAVPRHNLLIYPYPLDTKLKLLPLAACGEGITSLLEEWSPEFTGTCRPIERCRVFPLRYVPGKRCQHLYELQSGEASLTLLGKLFRSASSGADLYRHMRSVTRLYEAHGDPGLGAPSALGCHESSGMLFQERVRGVTLYQLMQARRAGHAHLRAAARLLSVLHGGAVTVSGRHGVTEELDVVSNACKRLPAIGEPAPPGLQASLARMAPPDQQYEDVLVHRDYYDRQLIAGDRRTWLIDLDSLISGPREIDLANFAAHVELRALQGCYSRSEAGEFITAFLDEYELSSRAKVNLPVYRFFRATTLARLGCLYRFRQYGTDLPDRLFGLAARAGESATTQLEVA